MNSASEKRKTQIDFKRALGPPLKTGVIGETIKELEEEEGYKYGKRVNLKPDAAKTSTRKRSLSPEGDRVENPTSLKSLSLPEIIRSGIGVDDDDDDEYLKTTFDSPWQKYEKCYDIRLGEDDLYLTVAERRIAPSGTLTRRDPFSELALVRSFSGLSLEDKLHKFQEVRDASIVSPIEIFRLDGTCYVVFEYMAYSLYYVAGNPRLDEIRLAAIVAQILDGLIYLASEGLEHGSLTCSNILIHPCGDVKIASQECCELRSHNSTESRHFRALGIIVMELMQGYAKEDGAIGVEDLHRWPSDCNAVNFLSTTVTANSLEELMMHPLLRLPWRKGMLQGLVSFVTIGTRIGRRYPPK